MTTHSPIPVLEPCDHDWKLVDDSFDHEFGTEVCGHMQCTKCEETREIEDGEFDDFDEFDRYYD